MSKNKVPRVSRKPLLTPAVLNAWQGNPAKSTSNLNSANEPFDVVVTNGNTLTDSSLNSINVDAQPVFVTAAGSLGTVLDGSRGSATFTIEATDPESGTITFAHV